MGAAGRGGRRGRRWVFRAIAALVPLLLICGALEVIARVRHARRRSTMWMADRDICTRPSDADGRVYEYIPGKCDTNARGFPDVDRATPKPPGTRRVVVVGDSVAEGIGVDRPKRFGPLLETRLNDGGGEKVEVAVVAVSGYSTQQELALAPEIIRLEPDLVLWIYCLNDPAHPFYDNASGDVNQFHDRPRSHALRWLGASLHKLKHLYYEKRGWCTRQHEGDGLASWIEALHCWEWPQVAADLGRVAHVAGPAVPVAFSVFPFVPEETWDGYFGEPLTGKLLAEARARGMETLDLREAFVGVPPSTVHQEDDRWHASEAGHALLASYLEPRVRALLDAHPIGAR